MRQFGNFKYRIEKRKIAIVEYCGETKTVIVPKTIKGLPVTRIDGGAFAFEDYCTPIEHLILPDSVTEIGYAAFEGCYALKSITSLKSVSKIEHFAFLRCHSLETVSLSDKLTEIEAGAFCDCYSLNNIILPESVTEIGVGAFTNCTSLNSITLSSKVTYIGAEAFKGCSSLAIYCEAETMPEPVGIWIGWDEEWNPDERPVYWGIKQEKDSNPQG